jgi:UDP-glucose 4-epimerase
MQGFAQSQAIEHSSRYSDTPQSPYSKLDTEDQTEHIQAYWQWAVAIFCFFPSPGSSEALKINNVQQPVSFYASVVDNTMVSFLTLYSFCAGESLKSRILSSSVGFGKYSQTLSLGEIARARAM